MAAYPSTHATGTVEFINANVNVSYVSLYNFIFSLFSFYFSQWS